MNTVLVIALILAMIATLVALVRGIIAFLQTTKEDLNAPEGSGPSPTSSDVALVGYKGALLDGTVFDENPQAPMPIDGVVPGFSEGLQKMKKGGKYKLWIPSELGYGAEDNGPIPGGSVLVFDVTLHDFKSKAELMQLQQQMMQQQGAMPQPGQ